MSLATPVVSPEVSILAPANDEADNLPEFVRQTREALLALPYAAELIVVNDGSEDRSATILHELAAANPFLRVVTHRSRRGIADSLKSAAETARGRVLVFYPADLQYAPSDIPRGNARSSHERK